jgi:hypothetical protein
METPLEKANEIYYKMDEFCIFKDDALQCAIVAVNCLLDESLENGTDKDYDGQYYIDENMNCYGYNQYYKMVIEILKRNLNTGI